MTEDTLFRTEELHGRDYRRTAGIDEVGRGPLAGPVVAAAVVCLDKNSLPEGICDSKKLTDTKRKEIAADLTSNPNVKTGIGIISAAEIDRLDILRATHEAMKTAWRELACPCDFALIDGRPVKDFPVASEAVVQGDSKHTRIAAASILAKVKRDTLMEEWDGLFPGYGFARNKGYGTKEHLQAIQQRGVTRIHRKTFRPIRDLEKEDTTPSQQELELSDEG